MKSGGLLVPDRVESVRTGGSGQLRWTERAWSLLGWIGVTLAAMGLADVFLTWYPFSFGNPEWEFGTVTQSFNGLPSVTVGMGLWLASAVVAERRWLVRFLAAGFIVLGVLTVLAALLYAMTVPLALDSVPPNAIATGLKKAIAKTVTQAIMYPVVFVVIGVKGLRAAKEAAELRLVG